MQLLAIEVSDFRNLQQVLLTPHPRMNVLWGPNGQGKTNLLEAIYVLGTLRGCRAGGIEELVRFGTAEGWVRGRVARAGLERVYEVSLRAQPTRLKRARIDGKAVRAAGDYFGGFNVVLFAPEDLRLVRGAPGERRRFLDRAVSNAMPAFLGEAQTYERVMRARNAVLRDTRMSRAEGEALLEVYDVQLARAGGAIVARRRTFLDALRPRVQAAHERITRSGLALTLDYTSRGLVAEGAAQLAEELHARLQGARRRDRERGYTTVGPHGDDLDLGLGGFAARLHASQGQVRAIVLALKVAEIEHLADLLGEPPILLLDDVSSELDPERTAYLFEFIADLSCQAYLTTTAPAHLALPRERAEFQLSQGTVTPRSNGNG